MPLPIIGIIAILAGAGVASFLIWSVSSIVRSKLDQSHANEASLRTSELEMMIEHAALKAVLPIQRRLEALESAFVDDPSTELTDAASQNGGLLADSDSYHESDSELDKIRVSRGIESRS